VATAERGSFVDKYLNYVRHVVVADESFFGTVLRNTKFCKKHHNSNFLHVQFDRWENEIETEKRDPRKCLLPDPDRCGRSPTTMTLDYLSVLELSGDLFARKFLDGVDSRIKDVLDRRRAREEASLGNTTEGMTQGTSLVDTSFEGHGVLIVARATVNDRVPLCLGLGPSQNKIRLTPCFNDWVPETLAQDWETGGVIVEETMLHNRWQIGPCSSDGDLKRLRSGVMQMTPGEFSDMGPQCMLKQIDGIRKGRCFDGDTGKSRPGGPMNVFPCVKRWHQFVSFGNGEAAPVGSIHTTVPGYIRNQIATDDFEQEPYMCFGVKGRGDMDEEDWKIAGEQPLDEDQVDSPPGLKPLGKWSGQQLITTRCSNTDAVIEWLYVPYIVEDESQSDEDSQHADTDEEL